MKTVTDNQLCVAYRKDGGDVKKIARRVKLKAATVQRRLEAMPAAALESDELWVSYKKTRSVDVRNRLMEIYLPLVKHHGRRIWASLPPGVELDDLISVGVFGLMDAIGKFDLARGIKFETYCLPRIRGAMLDELCHMDWVPRLVRSQASKLKAATQNVETRLGRPSTEIELAAEMGLSVKKLKKMIVDADDVGLISLHKKWYETDSLKIVCELDILMDKKGEDPAQRIEKNDLMRLAMKGFNHKERLLIISYYYQQLTMKEIGASLNLSESRVSQMHSQIICRLRQNLKLRRQEFVF